MGLVDRWRGGWLDTLERVDDSRSPVVYGFPACPSTSGRLVNTH